METKLTLTITLEDGTEVSLSEAQAKELHGKLEELFGSNTQFIPMPGYPSPYIPGPIWTNDGTQDRPQWDDSITISNGDPDRYEAMSLHHTDLNQS